MTAPGKPRGNRAPKEGPTVLGALERLNQKQHAEAQLGQLKAFLVAELAPMKAAISAGPPPPPSAELPRWMKLTFATAAGLVAVCTLTLVVFAGIDRYAGNRADDTASSNRLAQVEREIAAGTVRVAAFEQAMAALRERTLTVEQARAQGRQIVDQQMESLKDRIRLLEASDATSANQLNEALRALAASNAENRAHAARLDEATRRLERLEQRLGSARPGLNQEPPSAPALAPPEHI